MYRSVGKLPRSETIVSRAGAAARCRRSAATSTLYRLTDVESAQMTSSAAAPISRAILPPTRRGASIQPAAFHEPISPRPHSSSTTAASRAGVAAGSAPSELPSR